MEAFLQVFVRREYAAISAIAPRGLIIDCGANVGYSSAWLLSRFPDATIIPVEPDPGNYELLKLNLAPFGTAVTTIRGAVWSHMCGLTFDRTRYRDGLSWSVRVHEVEPGKPTEIAGFDIPSLLQMSSASRIALLKMDVEGAEVEIFADRPEWVKLCDNIAIELHDSRCEEVFFRAISNEDFIITKSGELTICTRH